MCADLPNGHRSPRPVTALRIPVTCDNNPNLQLGF